MLKWRSWRKYKIEILALVLGSMYSAIILLMHDFKFGDWKFFAAEDISLGYGIDRWLNWSSRLLIENAVNFFAHNMLLWAILTILAGAILVWSIARILKIDRIYQIIVLFTLLIMINISTLATAGVFATTINYLWPMACFTFIAASILRPFSDKRVKIAANLALIPLVMFAFCSEQLAVLAILIFIPLIIYLKIQKQQIDRRIWALLIIAGMGVLNAAVSPGNAIRLSAEAAHWWPEFVNYNLVQKILVGVTVTFSRLFLAPEFLMIAAVLLVLILAIKARSLHATVSIMPVIVMMGMFLYPVSSSMLNPPNRFADLRGLALEMSSKNIIDLKYQFIFATIFVLFIGCLLVSWWFIYGNTRKFWIMATLIVSGLGISLLATFSPTLFASSTRTLYYLYNILIIVNFVLIDDVLGYFKDKSLK